MTRKEEAEPERAHKGERAEEERAEMSHAGGEGNPTS